MPPSRSSRQTASTLMPMRTTCFMRSTSSSSTSPSRCCRAVSAPSSLTSDRQYGGGGGAGGRGGRPAARTAQRQDAPVLEGVKEVAGHAAGRVAEGEVPAAGDDDDLFLLRHAIPPCRHGASLLSSIRV